MQRTRSSASLSTRSSTGASTQASWWAEFFRRFPRSPGLGELGPVRYSSGGKVAETVVGRPCGEHCRNAWRVVARRDAGAWKVAEVQWLRVPEA